DRPEGRSRSDREASRGGGSDDRANLRREPGPQERTPSDLNDELGERDEVESPGVSGEGPRRSDEEELRSKRRRRRGRRGRGGSRERGDARSDRPGAPKAGPASDDLVPLKINLASEEIDFV